MVKQEEKKVKQNLMKTDSKLEKPKDTVGMSRFNLFLMNLVCLCLTVHSVHVISTQGMNRTPLLVWCCGWITCVCTGIGALPFCFMSSVSSWTEAVCNAIAAGMMMSASIGLIGEGIQDSYGSICLHAMSKMVIGFWLGVAFIQFTETFLEDFDKVKELSSLCKGIDMKRIILFFSVMCLHSLAEGVAVGVSFHSMSLGKYITTTLSIHNIPEGLALSIILIPSGIDVATTFLLCILSSAPQPFFAVPAFIFVEAFKIIVPIGLGFAAGAMIYVTIFELYKEAKEILGSRTSIILGLLSGGLMSYLQVCAKVSE